MYDMKTRLNITIEDTVLAYITAIHHKMDFFISRDKN